MNPSDLDRIEESLSKIESLFQGGKPTEDRVQRFEAVVLRYINILDHHIAREHEIHEELSSSGKKRSKKRLQKLRERRAFCTNLLKVELTFRPKRTLQVEKSPHDVRRRGSIPRKGSL